MLCYSTISQSSFESIQEKWAPEIDHYIKDVPLMLVGTKVDLRKEEAKDPNSGVFDPIKTEEGAKLAEELGAFHIEISAKTGENLTEAFEKAIELGLELKGGHGGGSGAAGAASVGGARRKKKEKGNCVLV
jgi:GTPase SAR1 family protein